MLLEINELKFTHVIEDVAWGFDSNLSRLRSMVQKFPV